MLLRIHRKSRTFSADFVNLHLMLSQMHPDYRSRDVRELIRHPRSVPECHLDGSGSAARRIALWRCLAVHTAAVNAGHECDRRKDLVHVLGAADDQ